MTVIVRGSLLQTGPAHTWIPCNVGTLGRLRRATPIFRKGLDKRQHSPSQCPTASGERASHLATRVLIPVVAASAFVSLLLPDAASAFEIHAEPGNALSLPTWAIHVSSVLEWVAAMGLMWKYADATGNPRWKGMTWGMMPCLGSAMAACTWHFFYNSPDLEFLVVVQSALTVVGNCTCWWAAYRLYEAAMAEKSST